MTDTVVYEKRGLGWQGILSIISVSLVSLLIAFLAGIAVGHHCGHHPHGFGGQGPMMGREHGGGPGWGGERHHEFGGFGGMHHEFPGGPEGGPQAPHPVTPPAAADAKAAAH